MGFCVACVHASRVETSTVVAQVVGSSIQYPFIWVETGIPYVIAITLYALSRSPLQIIGLFRCHPFSWLGLPFIPPWPPCGASSPHGLAS